MHRIMSGIHVGLKSVWGYSSFMSHVVHLESENHRTFEGNELSLPHLKTLQVELQSLYFLHLSWTFWMTYFSADKSLFCICLFFFFF